MKKHIIITLILLAATVYVTVVYFKNLNPPGTRTSQVMHVIPDNAALVFEYNNDSGFYDIFKDNRLFSALLTKEKLGDLDTLKQQLLQNPLLERYFAGQNIFISLHPLKTTGTDLLLSMSTGKGFGAGVLKKAAQNTKSGLVVTPMHIDGKTGFNIFINVLRKRFFLVNQGNNVFSGSFSKELADMSAAYKEKPGKETFVLLSEQQSNNSLANLYVNYAGLSPLFDQLFKNKNIDILKNFKQLAARAALSLNYRSDALMFNGSSVLQTGTPQTYLDLFAEQQPVINHLKDILPSTTAYGTVFAVSNPQKFSSDLVGYQNEAGFAAERDKLYAQIKAETAVKINNEFNALLGNEFALVTTRYFEKFAVISVKDGSKLQAILTGISIMNQENEGQLSYEKLPFFLLGDAFSIFRRPYFIIIDNYLVLANSSAELNSFNDIYLNRKFLSKNEQYNQFDNLLAGQSNVSFFIQFKNAQPVLERDMHDNVYRSFKSAEPGWKDFYGASVQLTAVDKNFYTNFCIKLSTDTVAYKLK